jgi:hypothetical protein
LQKKKEKKFFPNNCKEIKTITKTLPKTANSQHLGKSKNPVAIPTKDQ